LIPFPNKKYNIIYADPAWHFKTYSNKGEKRSAIQYYDCLDINDIYNLPVNDIANDDCILFIWVIDSMLPEALQVIKKWNFKYKTVAFTWVKQNKKSDGYFTGMGYWTRCNPEQCLLATKGNPKRLSKAVRQLIISKRQEHSRKPDEIRNRIVELCGDLPRIELFARNKTKGWSVWGNEV
jgi:N6-adenosine-specific RNA methylase IME4|tara:strand:+ start:282 stop:821 length:540 start_codon:yes stop_codon:yes gene_type:complete